MGLMLVRILLMARLLSLPVFAQFSGGLLVSSTFCMLACLGLQSLLQRELPVQIVRRREIAGQVLIAQCLIVAFACAALGLIVAAAGFAVAGLGPQGMALGVLHGLSQQSFLIATVESRSRGEPLRFAMQNLSRSVALLGVGLVVAVATGSAAWVLGTEAVVSFAFTNGTLRGVLGRTSLTIGFVYRLAVRRLEHVSWSSALALLAVAVTGFASINADRWVAAELLTATTFAQYAFGWIILTVAQSVQVVCNASVYPLFARKFANFGGAETFRVCARISIALLLLCSLAAVLSFWALDLAIVNWFPAYSDSRVLLPIFLCIAILRVSDFWSSFLVIAGLERRLLLINVAVMAFASSTWVVWAQPWLGGIGLRHIAVLGALLTLLSYMSALLCAWHAAKR
jgi:O-antigen/teichoic acid export membrane protein